MFWQDKIIVVTGGSSGLGKELAQAFGKAGGKVVIAALEPDIVESAAAELQQEDAIRFKKGPELSVYHWMPKETRNIEIWLPVE